MRTAPGPGTAGLAATAPRLASALGGWMAGFVADRIGRVLHADA